jgi:class 3 adenylate cyclase
LGEYDLVPPTFRAGGNVLLSRSTETLVREIDEMTARVEPLASYIPMPFLTLLVQSAATRKIDPDFPQPTVVFVNLIGPPESVDAAQPEEESHLVETFSRLFSLINAAVETRGGVLKKVTYHVGGSDIVIYFGVPTAHTDNTVRAAHAALAIRDIVTGLKPTIVGGQPVTATCQIGLACGNVFSAEIGEPRGRREFNVLGDTVNTSARLMDRAVGNRIFMTETVYSNIEGKFEVNALEPIALKGKAAPTPVYELLGPAKPEQA